MGAQSLVRGLAGDGDMREDMQEDMREDMREDMQAPGEGAGLPVQSLAHRCTPPSQSRPRWSLRPDSAATSVHRGSTVMGEGSFVSRPSVSLKTCASDFVLWSLGPWEEIPRKGPGRGLNSYDQVDLI